MGLVQIAFASDTFDTSPTWTSLDDYATGYSIRRGRQFETDQTEGGSAQITLVDTSGRLDPTNETSDLFGLLLPLKQVQISINNPVTNEDTVVFTGFVEDYAYEIDTAEGMITVTVDCVDGFDILAAAEVIPGDTGSAIYQSLHVDDAIRARLADADWPATWTRIFTGNVNVQAVIYQPGTDILTTLQDCADAEFPGVANIFIGKDGYFVFHGRYARFIPANYAGLNPPILTWNLSDEENLGGDDWVRIADLKWNIDKTRLINTCLASPAGIAATDVAGQLSTDPTSIGQYGVRALPPLDGLLTADSNDDGNDRLAETKLFADYYTENFAQPQQRISTLVFKSVSPTDPTNAGTWAFLVGVEISHLLLITTTFLGDGGFDGSGFFVEGIQINAVLGSGGYPGYPQLTVSLNVSPQAWFTTFPT